MDAAGAVVRPLDGEALAALLSKSNERRSLAPGGSPRKESFIPPPAPVPAIAREQPATNGEGPRKESVAPNGSSTAGTINAPVSLRAPALLPVNDAPAPGFEPERRTWPTLLIVALIPDVLHGPLFNTPPSLAFPRQGP